MNNQTSRKFRVRLIIDISFSYGRNLLQGISQYVQKFKNWEFETTFSYFGDNQYKKYRIDKNNTADGIIVFSPEKEVLTEVLKSDIPAIIKGVDKPVSGYINFQTDNMMLCKKAFDHFRHIGFERMAYCGLHNVQWSKERCQAMQDITAVNHYELSVYTGKSYKTVRKGEHEKNILEEWLKSLPKPIGLLAANDFRGKEVLEACQSAGIKVPEEIAILGVDNDDCICPFTNPPLSSIGRFFHKAGYEAALTLNCLMSGEKPERQEIIIEPQEVIQRQSTDILAVDNKTVAEALLFIRSHKHLLLTVAKVSEHVAVHDRVLYNLFKKYLGYTVHEEIKRVKSDEIARLLLQTDLSVFQIAQQMGFENADNFSRYFFKAKGMSPMAHRHHYNPIS